MVICLWVVSLSCLNMANAAAEHTRLFLEVNRIVHRGLQHPRFLAEPSGHRSPRRGCNLLPTVTSSPWSGCSELLAWDVSRDGASTTSSLETWSLKASWCAPSGTPVMWEQTDGCLSRLCIPHGPPGMQQGLGEARGAEQLGRAAAALWALPQRHGPLCFSACVLACEGHAGTVTSVHPEVCCAGALRMGRQGCANSGAAAINCIVRTCGDGARAGTLRNSISCSILEVASKLQKKKKLCVLPSVQ